MVVAGTRQAQAVQRRLRSRRARARGSQRHQRLDGVPDARRGQAEVPVTALSLQRERMVGTGMESWRYRWVVVGVSTSVNTLAWGARSTFALFYVAMLEEFAWGRGATALGYSLSWLCFVVWAPAAGWLSDRWGA